MANNSKFHAINYQRNTKTNLVMQQQPDSRWKAGLWGQKRKIDFTAADAARQRLRFGQELLKIGDQINLKARKVDHKALQEAIERLPEGIDAVLEVLRPALEFAPAAAEGYLEEMKAIGLRLYRSLGDEIRAELASRGLLAGDPLAAPQYSLSFALDPDTAEARIPVCWHLLYRQDDRSLDVEWQRFWGFHMAISQWLNLERNPEIKLTPALVAVDDMLQFPTFEKGMLGRLLGQQNTFGLDDKLFPLACSHYKMLEALNSDEEGKERLQAQSPQWLQTVLRKIDDQYAPHASKMPKWLQQQLIALFTGEQAYGIIHFACHFRPELADDGFGAEGGNVVNSERRLELRIAGGAINLDHDFIKTNLWRDLQSSDPAGVVFLNACSSGEQLQAQFPDLPKFWIEQQGATAVIATICEVPDIFAYAFALKFYHILYSAQKEFGERLKSDAGAEIPRHLYFDWALLMTRRFFMEHFHNPMGLAYELYAFPDACVQPILGQDAA